MSVCGLADLTGHYRQGEQSFGRGLSKREAGIHTKWDITPASWRDSPCPLQTQQRILGR